MKIWYCEERWTFRPNKPDDPITIWHYVALALMITAAVAGFVANYF